MADEAILANPAESGNNQSGLLDSNNHTLGLAICRMEIRIRRDAPSYSTHHLGLIGIAVVVLAIVLLVGFSYDVTFGLWRDHITINQERNPFTTYKLNPTQGLMIAQTNEILRRVASEDEDIQRYCRFVDRMLDWNAREEIWARAMSSWKEIMQDEDPFLFYLDEDARQKLDSAASKLEDF